MHDRVTATLRRRKYAILLALQLVALSIQSFDVRLGAEGVVSNVFRMVLGIAILAIVFGRPGERRWMGTILFALVAIGWWHHAAAERPERALTLVLHALLALYLWVAVGVILRDLFRARAVGAENVLGAICGYVIAGEAWAGINGVRTCWSPPPTASAPTWPRCSATGRVDSRCSRTTASPRC
jgi:hypothetical protein